MRKIVLYYHPENSSKSNHLSNTYNLHLTPNTIHYYYYHYSSSRDGPVIDKDNTYSSSTTNNTSTGTTTKDNNTNTANEVEIEEELCTIILSETDTYTILDIPSTIIFNDNSEECQAVITNNNTYERVKQRHISASDSYIQHATQTLNELQKNQNEMTIAIASLDFGGQAYSYEINDDVSKMLALQQGGDEGVVSPRVSEGNTGTGEGDRSKLSALEKYVSDTVSASLLVPGCLLDMNIIKRPPASPKGRNNGQKGRSGHSTVGASFMGGGGGGGGGGMSEGASGMLRQSMGGGVGASNSRVVESHANYSAAPSNYGHTRGTASKYGASKVGGSSATAAGGAQEATAIASSEYMFGSLDTEPVVSDGETLLREERARRVLASPQLIGDVLKMERAVLQNTYHRRQTDFRDASRGKVHQSDLHQGSAYSGSEGMSSASGSLDDLIGRARRKSRPASTKGHVHDKFDRLFHFRSPDLVGDREVTCMAFNPSDTSLLAVGYALSPLSHEDEADDDPNETPAQREERKHGGLVLFWSPRNPKRPEKILRTASGVSCLGFSSSSPLTLAVGMRSGDLAVYNLRREDWSRPIESSDGVSGSHTETIWFVYNTYHISIWYMYIMRDVYIHDKKLSID